jgi:AcrR family transcriptional regulator
MTASTNDLRSKQDVFKQRPAILESSILDRPGRAAPRTEAKRARIVDAAMQHFAEHGYHAARIEDLSAQLGVAKGSIFQYFGSKGGLFLEAYKKAVRSFPTYLDSPPLVREDWIPYRVALLGNYGVDLSLKREINRFLQTEDPYGSAAFVRLGIARGEVRSDVDSTLTVSILDWTMERFQDALLTEELDPGLFPHPADAQKNKARIDQFLLVLHGAIGV